MTDPALAVQEAVIAALRLSSLNAVVNGRIYDSVPATKPGATPTFPYVTFGEAQSLPERADCIDGTEHFFTVHAWSRAVGFPEVKRMAGAIREALHEAEIEVTGYRLIDLALQNTQFMRDPDGLTSHGVMTFRAMLDAT